MNNLFQHSWTSLSKTLPKLASSTVHIKACQYRQKPSCAFLRVYCTCLFSSRSLSKVFEFSPWRSLTAPRFEVDCPVDPPRVLPVVFRYLSVVSPEAANFVPSRTAVAFRNLLLVHFRLQSTPTNSLRDCLKRHPGHAGWTEHRAGPGHNTTARAPRYDYKINQWTTKKQINGR